LLAFLCCYPWDGQISTIFLYCYQNCGQCCESPCLSFLCSSPPFGTYCIYCSKASVINNYEDNSWAFVVITCLFA
jgi:hypothetical protein